MARSDDSGKVSRQVKLRRIFRVMAPDALGLSRFGNDIGHRWIGDVRRPRTVAAFTPHIRSSFNPVQTADPPGSVWTCEMTADAIQMVLLSMLLERSVGPRMPGRVPNRHRLRVALRTGGSAHERGLSASGTRAVGPVGLRPGQIQ